jgi:poly(3-hydroxybutyrate) depolymerase
MGAGHYGIFSGRRWREQVYPTVRDFIVKYGSGPLPAGAKAGKSAPRKTARKTRR